MDQDRHGLTLGSSEQYTGNSSAQTHQAFLDYFNTVSQLLGANGTTMTQAEDLWLLEMAIAKVMLSLHQFITPSNRNKDLVISR